MRSTISEVNDKEQGKEKQQKKAPGHSIPCSPSLISYLLACVRRERSSFMVTRTCYPQKKKKYIGKHTTRFL